MNFNWDSFYSAWPSPLTFYDATVNRAHYLYLGDVWSERSDSVFISGVLYEFLDGFLEPFDWWFLLSLHITIDNKRSHIWRSQKC